MAEKVASLKKIKLLFASDVSSYKIAKVAGLNRMTVWNMREGVTDLDKIEFNNAVLLTKAYDQLKKEGVL